VKRDFLINLKNFKLVQNLGEEMYSFLPNKHVVHGVVISWQPEIIFFLSLRTSRSNGITQEMIDARWSALKQVFEFFFWFPYSPFLIII
jgi:hypothetical protein